MSKVEEAAVNDFVVSQKSAEVVPQRFLVASHASAEVVEKKTPKDFVPSQVSTRAFVKYRLVEP